MKRPDTGIAQEIAQKLGRPLPPPRKLGKIRQEHTRDGRGNYYPTRYHIDFGRHGGKLYSIRGLSISDSYESCEKALEIIRAMVEGGRSLRTILGEIGPEPKVVQDLWPLIERYVRLFRKKVRAGDRAPRTLLDYERISHPTRPTGYLRWWKGKTLFDVNRPSLEEFSYWLFDEHQLGPKSRANILLSLGAILTWAEEQNPDFRKPRISLPEVPEHVPQLISRAEQTRILNLIPWRRRGAYLAMADLCIRPSEARATRVCDWQGDKLTICRAAKEYKVGGKMGPLKARNVKVLPVTPRLLEWLEAHYPPRIRMWRGPNALLFRAHTSINRDAEWSVDVLNYHWRKACRRARVAPIPLYDGTKHSTATALKTAGADDRALAALLGHGDVASVARYARIQPEAIRATLARIK